MDYLISYEWIYQGSKQKMNTIQRVSVNTYKTMNFTISNNTNISRYKFKELFVEILSIARYPT